MNLMSAFKAAFDSLVRSYSPMLVGLIVGALAAVLGIPVPDEVHDFVVLLVAFGFAALWYGTLRVVELVRGKTSKWLLGLGLVASQPLYGTPATDHNVTVNPTVAAGAVDEAIRSRQHDIRDTGV
ncbi:hypothetical protein O1W71_01875 [Microbacterium sp. H37-C3]|uniref:hypothetical protein n=1 Tax=Microbacterium sp. H37-C3 TaxID=3004354 RepID=UPI0022AEE546|nr:hypothetical protein [Microbacterium sp. H37-C3]MCZ4066416.1 hypothetical protein [Microbacterium sp. H37-C3]